MLNSLKGVRVALVGLALSQALVGAAMAQPKFTLGAKDAALATAGNYKLDATHASVIAKVSHIGYSYSIFRFNDVSGTLAWDPAKPEASKLSVSIATASIDTNVPGFAEELAGDKFLKSTAFPKATFESTAFRKTDATHGQVDGKLTLLGKTVPITFDVTLVGAGPGFGSPRIGVEATGRVKFADVGINPMLGEGADLVIDVEFEKLK